MAESPNNEEAGQRDISRTNDYFPMELQGNYQAGVIVPPHYFTQHMYYPYVNPYSHLTESGSNLSVHGYGSDGRPKFRRSRTIFSPEQLDILEEYFSKHKYPDVKRRRAIAEELGLNDERVQVWFQNRRAKSKRQTDQQVKLQKLVKEAIGTGDKGCASGVVSQGNDRENHINKNESNKTLQIGEQPATAIPELKELQQPQHTSCNNELGHHSSGLLSRDETQGGSQDVTWSQRSTPHCYNPANPQLALQNIDQDLLFQVANILSASNDASSLIAEWSQSPNKVQTTNIEDQLRQFASHHQEVLVPGDGESTAETYQKEQSTTTPPASLDHHSS